MNKQPAHGRTVRLHTCSICGKESEWGHSWAWIGSLADMDDGKSVVKTCSEKCLASYWSPETWGYAALTVDLLAQQLGCKVGKLRALIDERRWDTERLLAFIEEHPRGRFILSKAINPGMSW